MPNVARLPLPPVPIEADPDHHPALRRLGQWLAWSLTGLLGLGGAFAAVVLTLGLACGGAFLWLGPGAAYIGLLPTGAPDLVPFGDLPWPTRLAYAATFVFDTVPVFAVLAELRRLALAYAAGIAFGADAAGCLRRVGLWLVAYALAPALGHGLVLLAGHGVDLVWLHPSSFHALVLAFLLVTLAQVMGVGRAIQLDRDGFV